MIELYGMSSPNVRKVLIALEEIGLEYAVHHVSVFRGRQFEDDFLSLNPMAKVPVLIDRDGPAGEMPIFESGAILVYLAEQYGPEFLPRNGAERYAVLKWLFMQVANVGPALGNHSHFKGMAQDNPYAAARFRRMSAQVYGALERSLTEVPYLGGDRYSIADMAAHPWARRFSRFGLPAENFSGLLDWIERISARPAVRASDVAIKRLGEKDTVDAREATVEDMAKFTGQHIVAPTAEEAANLPPWWKGRSGHAEDSATVGEAE